MNAATRSMLALCAALASAPMARDGHAALPSSAEQAAIFDTAGFKKVRGQYVRCKDGTSSPSYMPGRIETVDINGDGKPEAWVRESSAFCYGNTAEFFVLLTSESGKWRVVLEAVGIATVMKTKSQGWPDIEVGGPGLRKFPVYQWNGKSYVLRK